MDGAYTDLPDGRTLRWHADTHSECSDPYCERPHASREALFADLVWPKP
jgi:hypothetical protein